MAMLHLDSPHLSREIPAEKENQIKHQKGLHESHLPRKRMALKAVNGEGPPSSAKQTPKTGRVALSNLTNTVTTNAFVAQKTPKMEMSKKVSSSSSTKSATAAKNASIPKRRLLPDIEQPYPKQIMPIFDEVPPLPKNWSQLSDVWALDHDLEDNDAPIDISIEALLLPHDPSLSFDFDEASGIDLSADLSRDLAEDAQCLAAQLFSES